METVSSASNTFAGHGFTSGQPPRSRRLSELRVLGKADPSKSAAEMCLWQELMIWYQGENASSFTDAFGKVGPMFVRGRSGQWRQIDTETLAGIMTGENAKRCSAGKNLLPELRPVV